MVLMKKFTDYFIRKPVKTLAGIALAGLAAYYAASHSMGKEVYRGDIEGFYVVYEEGRLTPIRLILKYGSFQMNKMTVSDGKTTMSFFDCLDETPFDFGGKGDMKFAKDNVEMISRATWKEERNYKTTNIYETEDSSRILQAATLEDINVFYNSLRLVIRNRLSRSNTVNMALKA